MKKWILILSIAFNIIFLLGWGLKEFNDPINKLGKLTRDLEIGCFMNDSTIFKLPKGLTVRNNSDRGMEAIGQFEFEIIITSLDNLVNYDLPQDSLASFGNYYSADIKKNIIFRP